MTKYDRGDVCCHHCFADRYLQELIKGGGERGHCPWCERRNVYLIRLEELSQKFRDVAKIYSPVESEEGGEHGEFIGTMMNYDWSMFDEKILGMGIENDLTQEILVADTECKNALIFRTMTVFLYTMKVVLKRNGILWQ